MPWFNVDDGFAFHRKTVMAGNAAVGLWTRAGSWCSRELTDGFVPDHMVSTMGSVTQAARLVKAGLWARDDERGGYQFHEWSLDGRNPTKKTVLAKRAKAAEKKRGQRAQDGHDSEDPQVDEVRPQGTEGGVPRGVPGVVNVPTPLPSLTTKTHPPSEGAPRSRGTRIPDDFSVTSEQVVWARERRPDVDGRMETERFINYWTAKTGKDATKKDWNATWRNWILGAKPTPNYRGPGLPGGTGSKRVDKALGFLSKDDPLRAELGMDSHLRSIEGGMTA